MSEVKYRREKMGKGSVGKRGRLELTTWLKSACVGAVLEKRRADNDGAANERNSRLKAALANITGGTSTARDEIGGKTTEKSILLDVTTMAASNRSHHPLDDNYLGM